MDAQSTLLSKAEAGQLRLPQSKCLPGHSRGRLLLHSLLGKSTLILGGLGLAREERGRTTQMRICGWLESFLPLGVYSRGTKGADFWASAQIQVVPELRKRGEALGHIK